MILPTIAKPDPNIYLAWLYGDVTTFELVEVARMYAIHTRDRSEQMARRATEKAWKKRYGDAKGLDAQLKAEGLDESDIIHIDKTCGMNPYAKKGGVA